MTMPDTPREPALRSVARDGVRLAVPDGWTVVEGPADGVAIVALAPPTGPDAFRANATVTVGPVPEGMTFREWQAGTDQILPRTLVGYLLLDLEHAVVAGLPAVRRLAHHQADGVPVTMAQTAVLADGRGITLTITVATPEWAHLAATADAIAASLELTARPAAGGL